VRESEKKSERESQRERAKMRESKNERDRERKRENERARARMRGGERVCASKRESECPSPGIRPAKDECLFEKRNGSRTCLVQIFDTPVLTLDVTV